MSDIPLLVVGAGGHASVVVDMVEQLRRHRIVGLIDDFLPAGTDRLGYKIIGGIQDIGMLAAAISDLEFIIAVGDNHSRSKIVNAVSSRYENPKFASIVHPSANVSGRVSLSDGVVVMAGASVIGNARIGAHAIINTNASVDHDVRMESFASVGPGGAVSGEVQIGRETAIGIGATVIEKVTIGAHCVIGAGAVVISDVPELKTVVGNPARVIGHRSPADSYLK